MTTEGIFLKEKELLKKLNSSDLIFQKLLICNILNNAYLLPTIVIFQKSSNKPGAGGSRL
jgi:hypothetical protein